jgi:hypothetical protein
MRAKGAIVAILVGVGLIGAVPAHAAFGAVVSLPDATAYSPYGGPATVTFAFAPDDAASAFTIRLRNPGHGVIHDRDVLVDPHTESSPLEVPFAWPKVTVGSPTDLVVDVRPQGGGAVITSAGFTLLPPLVSDLSATPSPFYPLIQDGYRDDTTIRFALASDVTDAAVHVYADDVFGRCCGPEIRGEDLGPLTVGRHSWVWDGTKDDLSLAAKGRYFVRIDATDTGAIDATSKPLRVELTTGKIRLTATRVKDGSAFAHYGDEVQTAAGGECFVTRDRERRLAQVTCANAAISVFWRWALPDGGRIQSVGFSIDGSSFGCHKRTSHAGSESVLRVLTPPTSTCYVKKAKITYSYPVLA